VTAIILGARVRHALSLLHDVLAHEFAQHVGDPIA
jgi:hypothetical protein